MNKPKLPKELTGRLLAEEVNQFLQSDLGIHLLKVLSLKYNELHHQAEGEFFTVEQKAMKIERAAGVKWVIDWLMNRERNLTDGYWEQPKEPEQEP